MARQFSRIEPARGGSTGQPRLCFTASAAASGRMIISRCPADAFRILDPTTVICPDATRGGNEPPSYHLATSIRSIDGFETDVAADAPAPKSALNPARAE